MTKTMITLNRTRLTALTLCVVIVAFVFKAHGQAAPAEGALARFPVAHQHKDGWCLGYLYVYPDSIAYETTWPVSDKNHSFKLWRSDLKNVGRWSRSGQTLKAVELKSSKITYRFWWLANEQDVINGRAYQGDPSDAGDPDLVIAALRDPTTLITETNPQAQIPVMPDAGAAPPSQSLPGSQGTPLTVGPLTLTVPSGWTSQPDSKSVKIFAPNSSRQQYLEVRPLFAKQITQDVRDYHNGILQRVSALIPAGSPRQDGATGKFIWTRYVMQRPGGQPQAMILYSAKTGSTYVAIGVEATDPQLLPRYLPAIEAMVRGATLDELAGAPASSPVSPPAAASNSSGAPASARAGAQGPATLDDYIFTAPSGWSTKRNPDSIVLESPLLGVNEKCFLFLWPMRPAGPDLVVDANRAFADVWGAFELRNRDGRGGDMPPVIVRGTSGQGWDYVIVKRGIGPRGSRETRLGFALVAKLRDRLAVISGLSKDPLVSACFGELQANLWPRFFYNLSFKNWTPSVDQAAMRRKMAGVWIGGGATAADSFTFSANGRYGGASASQRYSGLSTGEVLSTTTAYFGDGAYTLRGDSITFTPANGNAPSAGFVRIEEESKDEGRNWTESLYLLRTSKVNGEEYEMKYHRSR